MTGFALQVGDGIDLVLRESWTNAAMEELIASNLDRLREWERWAHFDRDPQRAARFVTRSLHEWADGRNLPTVVRVDGRIVGSLGARVDPDLGIAQLGYWLDRGAEGRGVITRAARALIEQLFAHHPVHRIEIRAAAGNVRSRAVADRLGFVHEGTLRSAFPVGNDRHDEAIHGLLRTDLAS